MCGSGCYCLLCKIVRPLHERIFRVSLPSLRYERRKGSTLREIQLHTAHELDKQADNANGRMNERMEGRMTDDIYRRKQNTQHKTRLKLESGIKRDGVHSRRDR